MYGNFTVIFLEKNGVGITNKLHRNEARTGFENDNLRCYNKRI